MSTDYYLWCPKCEKISGILHAQQAWGSWTVREDPRHQEVHNWIKDHRDHKPYLVDEHSAENDKAWDASH
ncbi:hypothetical protein [Bradyrhizobium sp. AUGA SZCCT0431]|uniref:hypothetical protein n=1 Tax=Bradyrhizobium sp. AUGA SZCCT0431 TaxID=2807674 RepID=UPI001BA54E0A|nr:hypothetical protein [Bradyrhizobium sp. AUGA SZCCT0431]MBR1146655.1 hypothetical protein [Bradyrhizobium sp. AUGA SZCCT0431]